VIWARSRIRTPSCRHSRLADPRAAWSRRGRRAGSISSSLERSSRRSSASWLIRSSDDRGGDSRAPRRGVHPVRRDRDHPAPTCRPASRSGRSRRGGLCADRPCTVLGHGRRRPPQPRTNSVCKGHPPCGLPGPPRSSVAGPRAATTESERPLGNGTRFAFPRESITD